MGRDNERGVLADVAGGLFCTGLDYERTEATEIHVFAVRKAVLDNGHKLFDNGNNRRLVDAGCLCDFTRYICFSHFSCITLNLMSFQIAKLLKITEFRNEYRAPSPPVAAEIFGKMRAMEHLRFTALITDMAMATCFVWRATRHVSDGTL